MLLKICIGNIEKKNPHKTHTLPALGKLTVLYYPEAGKALHGQSFPRGREDEGLVPGLQVCTAVLTPRFPSE